MKFQDYKIHQSIKDQLTKLGFNRPTDIQFKAIQAIIDGEDVLAIAQTGTGKTAAFVIPTIERVLRSKQRNGVFALVLAPTRELAKQIASVFNDIGKQSKITVSLLHGGADQDPQIQSLQHKSDIVIATPGRVFDLIAQGHLNLKTLQTLIIDEADLMLDLGFIKDVQDLQKHLPKKRQTLFFSATITKKIKQLAYKLVSSHAIRIQISPKNPVSKNVEHAVAMVEMDDKRFFLESTLNNHPDAKIVVFVRTKVRVERVAKAMERIGIHVECLHGGMDQKERFIILDRFKSGENRVLISTDVAARGIDIPEVNYVINYDIPDVPENYVHRVGRTGRGTRKGQALSFCASEELPLLKEIEEYTGTEIVRYTFTKEEYEEIKFESLDPDYNWQKLLNEANKEYGTEDAWD